MGRRRWADGAAAMGGWGGGAWVAGGGAWVAGGGQGFSPQPPLQPKSRAL
jgi:hypothetical protein